ncbi:MAG TPA: hypothetical protein VNM48_09570 [Chloroflexota bacterium]|nr:hypothetical protein [Chloroflexota bacterium]
MAGPEDAALLLGSTCAGDEGSERGGCETLAGGGKGQSEHGSRQRGCGGKGKERGTQRKCSAAGEEALAVAPRERAESTARGDDDEAEEAEESTQAGGAQLEALVGQQGESDLQGDKGGCDEEGGREKRPDVRRGWQRRDDGGGLTGKQRVLRRLGD